MKSLFVAVNALIMVFAVVAAAQETFETDTLSPERHWQRLYNHLRRQKSLCSR